jgi:putative FmdB family regulatory protein
MPLYDYQCRACSHRFERIQKFSDPLVTTCPQCGKETVERLLSAPAVQFKGSGWYVTDYARKSSAPTPAKSEASGDSSKSASSESSSSGDASTSKPGSKESAASSSTSSSESKSSSAKPASGKD